MSTMAGGVCVLSLDSGGPGTYSQLVIMKEYMSRLADDMGVSEDDIYPADHFDLIGGVGFGGLVALMLGHLHMNVNQAIESLLDIVSAVFPEDSQEETSLEANSGRLKEAIESLLQARGFPLSAKMKEPSPQQAVCKVVLYAATSADVGHPHIFRTYSSRGSSLNPTIVEAVCATISIPSHFLPVKIGSRLAQQKFIGGPLGANNPTRELLKEAGIVFGNEKRLVQVINIGCGISHVLSVGKDAEEVGVGRLLKETAADCQMVARELEARLFNVEAYLRFNVDKGMDEMKVEDWSILGDVETHTRRYIEAPVVTAALDASVKCLRNKVGTTTLGRINQTSSIKLMAKMAPAVSSFYVVRKKPTGIMVHHLVTSPSSRQRIFPITGMGGSGKTQLVSHFLQNYSSLFTHTVFVDATSSSSIETDIQTWSRALGDGHEQDVWEDGLRFLSSTPSDTRQALIFDNADGATLKLTPFIPKNSSVTVIITSRNRELGNLSTTFHLELGEMEVEEALEALLHAARRESPLSAEELEKAYTLMKELGYLAVALVQAGTYCYQLSSYDRDIQNPFTFTQYMLLFYSHRAELMKQPQSSPLDSYERGVYTTLDISYKVIPPTAREFLHILSFFHHTRIPLAAFTKAARNQFSDERTLLPRHQDHRHVINGLEKLLCKDGTWNEFQVQEIVRTLRSFSLVSAMPVDDSLFLQLHPLVQAWSRDMVPSTKHYRAMTMRLLTSCHGDDAFRLYRHILPHILDLLSHLEIQDIHVNDLTATGAVLDDQGYYRNAAALFETALDKMTACMDLRAKLKVTADLAEIYWRDGRWDEAEKLEVEVLEQSRRFLGMDHPDTIAAAANLAATYGSQGRRNDAEKLEVEVLEQRRKLLGMDHPDTITAAGNLAGTYRSQGRWNDAEKLQVEVLEQRRRLLGMDHPDTITAAGSLAETYGSQGRWNDAEKLQVEVLEQSRRLLGMDHPDTIHAVGNLAGTYGSQGRRNDAEKLQVEVLEQSRRLLGMDHPDTITAVANLAVTYRSQGRWNDAEKLEVEVLEQRRKLLGMNHPDTITAAANLAVTYGSEGRWNDAEKLQVEVLEQSRRLLGMDHPHTITAVANLASTYWEQGRQSDAEKLEVEVLEQRRRHLGVDHPHTITAAANLAGTYRSQGRWNDAEKLELEVLEQCRRIHGMDHPDAITAAGSLAATYRFQGRWNDAEKLELEVLEQSRRLLGMDHPDTVTAASNLAETYRSQGRWNDAEKLQVEVLEQRRRLLGMDHPDTIAAAANLASAYRSQGRWNDAEKLEVEVLEQSRRLLGMDHPHTITTAANLAVTYSSQGRWNDAEKLQVEVLEQRRRLLGMDHPHTIIAVANMASTYWEQGRQSDAEKLEVEVLEQSRRLLGMDHPHTITAAANLAETYRSQGRWNDAEKLEVEVLEQRRRLLGMDHPDTITAAGSLAATYGSQGRWNDAGKLQVEVLEQSRRLLGMDHPHTITAAANLASIYRLQGRCDEALKLLEPTVKLSAKVLGQGHPDTQHRIRYLADTYEGLGRVAEAQQTNDMLSS